MPQEPFTPFHISHTSRTRKANPFRLPSGVICLPLRDVADWLRCHPDTVVRFARPHSLLMRAPAGWYLSTEQLEQFVQRYRVAQQRPLVLAALNREHVLTQFAALTSFLEADRQYLGPTGVQALDQECWLHAAEVAHVLAISTTTLNHWFHEGRLGALVLPGKHVLLRYPLSLLHQLATQIQQQPADASVPLMLWRSAEPTLHGDKVENTRGDVFLP